MNGDWNVVATDNFGMSGESLGKDEWYVLKCSVKEFTARNIARILNGEEATDLGLYYFKPVPEDYQLLVFEP